MSGEATLIRVERGPLVLPTTVVACGLTRHQRAYVVDGLRHRASCRRVDTLAELEELLRRGCDLDALVVAPEDGSGRSAVPVVERVAREWPDVAIVVFCPARADHATSLEALMLAGAHQVVFEGIHDTASALATAVDLSRREVAADAVYRRMAPLLPEVIQPMAQVILGRASALVSVEALANQMGVHRKTLVNRCAGGPRAAG